MVIIAHHGILQIKRVRALRAVSGPEQRQSLSDVLDRLKGDPHLLGTALIQALPIQASSCDLLLTDRIWQRCCNVTPVVAAHYTDSPLLTMIGLMII